MTLSWAPVLPVTLIVLLTLIVSSALAAGLVVMRRKGIARRWFWGLAALRVVAVALFVLCLAGPIMTFSRTETRKPVLLMLFDQSLASPAAPVESSRLDRELDWLQGSGLWAAVQDKYEVYTFAMHADADAVDVDQLRRLEAYPGPARYARALRTAWNHIRFDQAGYGLKQTPPTRAVMVSDGHDAGPEDIVETARRFGIPIDILAPEELPRETTQRDAAIVGLFAPGRVRLGAEARFLVSLYQFNTEPVTKTLVLLEDDEVVLEREVRIDGRSEQSVTLSWRPTSVGMRNYSLFLTDDPETLADEFNNDDEEEADRALSDREFRFHVRVDDQRHETLLLENSWRWEFKFLRRILEDDPLFSFSAFLERGAGSFVQFSDPERRVRLTGFPRTWAELEGFDIFIIGDVQPRQWPRTMVMALRNLVMENGKSLIVLAGPSLEHIAAVPELAELLPVELDRAAMAPRPGPIPIEISVDGMRAPFFFSAEDRQFWNDLPALDRIYAPLRKKPAATILVQATEVANEYGNLIVMAEHTVGRGRVLYIGTDTLWKWQMHGNQTTDGNTPYELFWQQALRAMAAGHAAPGIASLRLRSDRSSVVSGSRLTLYAEIVSDAQVPSPEIQGEILLPDERSQSLMFTRSPDNPSIYTTEFLVNHTGRHHVEATLLSQQAIVTESMAAFDVVPRDITETDIRLRKGNMQRIASQTGGRFLERDDPQSWPTASVPEMLQAERLRSLDFWHHLILPVLLVLVLGFDWLLRLIRGYV